MSAAATAGMAQGTVEALRFSQVYHSGTARFSAMGGAFAALGSDPTTLTYNPGGIGVYRSSEMTFTPHLLGAYNTADMEGKVLSDSKFKFGLSNFAGIFAFDFQGNGSPLKFLNFGIAYNKTNHFSDASMLRRNNFTWNGSNTMGDYFAALINNDNSNSEGKLAWSGHAIEDTASNPDGSEHLYYPNYQTANGTPSEQFINERRSTTTGTMGEYAFSIGGNVADIVYFGMTIGVVEIEYEERVVKSEISQSIQWNMDYTQQFRMDGSGYNFKFGVVVTPFVNADYASGLRIGAALHTPTFLELTDNYQADIKTSGFDAARSQSNEFLYRIETPLRCMAGLAYVFTGYGALRGIISADYEYVDYAAAKMSEHRDFNNPDLININNAIKDNFNHASNIRIGGELGYKNYSLRAGYAYYGNAYKDAVGKSSAVNVLSLGVGLRYFRNNYIDFAYTRSMQKDRGYIFYYNDALRSPQAKYSIAQNNFLLTFGWRF